MLATLAVGAFGGFAATWLMRQLALEFGIVSHPNPIARDYRGSVPYLGGPGIAIGAALALYLAPGADPHLRWPVVGGFIAFALLGLVDDLSPLQPLPKFLAQFAICAIVNLLHPTWSLWKITGWVWVDLFGASLWLVMIVNAVNFVDVCDGLAASVALTTLLCWVWVAPSGPATLYCSVAGALSGFLWWNKPPARIFMGDSGSLALGYLLGVAALDQFAEPPMRPLPLRLLALLFFAGVPLFELVFITTMRIRKGIPWWRGSPDHFALRLQHAGVSKERVDLLAATATIILWFSGFVLVRASSMKALAVLLLVIAGLTACWKRLLKWEVSPTHS
jgi:UDP-GlcNAc:undecaprenyl-phosphate/decaprenyl-phosphate GlcNAc-1-phosphate transferase